MSESDESDEREHSKKRRNRKLDYTDREGDFLQWKERVLQYMNMNLPLCMFIAKGLIERPTGLSDDDEEEEGEDEEEMPRSSKRY